MTHSSTPSAALVIACAALALSAYSALRGSGASSDGRACVDQQARDQTEGLRRTLTERDAMIARLARAASAAANGSTAAGDPLAGTPSPSPSPSPPSPPSSSPSPAEADRPRVYTHFEVPNPAVTVTQKPNGTYDIRTTDPKLSGTSLAIKAVTSSGDEDTLVIQVP
jgi:hypothetical protein